MTVATAVSSIIPGHFDIFAGLDVDKKSMATTFSDHGTLFKSRPGKANVVFASRSDA